MEEERDSATRPSIRSRPQLPELIINEPIENLNGAGEVSPLQLPPPPVRRLFFAASGKRLDSAAITKKYGPYINPSEEEAM